MAGASVKINFQVAGKDGVSFQEFLEAFPDVVLTEKQIEQIKEYLTGFCLAVLHEIDCENGKEIKLTLYLKCLIDVNENGEWYVTPFDGLKMFFHGLRVICIYNITYSPAI